MTQGPYGVVPLNTSDGPWALTCHGLQIPKRMRRFRKATWKTERGATVAATVLNDEWRRQNGV